MNVAIEPELIHFNMILTSTVCTPLDAIQLFEFGMSEILKTHMFNPWNITQIGSTIFNYVAVEKILYQLVQIPRSKFGMLTKDFVCQLCEPIKIMLKHWHMQKIENK